MNVYVIISSMKRLDSFLFEHGYYPSREKAKEAIISARVKVDNKVVTKPAYAVEDNAQIEALPFEFVSRGGFKLQKALEEFKVDLKDKVVVDIGASTGGFTDVCLKNGAKKVYAIDTGTDQLAESLRKDKRVVSLENTNYLTFDKSNFLDADFAVIDVSFVSLTKLAEKLSKDFNEIIALVKPQFECGKDYAKKHKGVVKDEKIHEKILKNITFAFKSVGFTLSPIIPSPILGGDGNKEFLLHAVKR